MKPGLRIGALGIVFLTLFGVLVLQLWRIQVIEAAVNEEQAQRNQVKLVETPAPRGEIRDRNGELLAGTQPALAAIVDGALVPEEGTPQLDQLVQRLSAFAGIAPGEVRHAVVDAISQGERITIVGDLEADAALRVVEYEEEFPGVSVVPIPVRSYPLGELASDILGYIGDPNAEDIKKEEIGPTDTVGRAGLERQYDDDLRGVEGRILYRLDAQRNVITVGAEQAPAPGANLELNVDVGIQTVLEESLAQGLELARQTHGDPECNPADDPACPVRAVGVVLDPDDGAVLAMASVPTYDPNIFVDGVSNDEWARLSEQAVFNNFAIQGVYAPASTFKAIAYVTALEEQIFPQEITEPSADGGYFCEGRLEFAFTDGSQQVFNDWTPDGHGLVDLSGALETSCDLYFWEIALSVWTDRLRDDGRGTYAEDLLQQWSRRFGFDEVTGVDLPFETDGLIPDRDWFERTQRESPGLVRDGPWTGGDVMNAVIGQGSVLATPLQLANAYAAIVNGGTVWQPRVVSRVVDQDGTVLRENLPTALREVELSPQTVAQFRRDLALVVNSPSGTARSAFEDFGNNVELVGGKTGTAEVIKGETAAEDVDTALFVGVAPIDDPEYVVAVVIERGGSGGRVAAPTARRILQYLLNGPGAMTEIIAGEEAD